TIGSYAFRDCSGIDSVYFYGDVPTIGSYAISNDLTLYYLEGNTSGWTTPTWTSSGGTVYNTATFVPGEENIKGEVSTTWNISPENIPVGDIYSFSGAVSTTAPSGLKDIQININSATEDGVGIKWYRGTSLGTASFDLSSVPEIKMGESYTGDNGQTITLSSGSEWNIQIFATDNRGNALGDKIIKKITVVRVDNAPPVVEMLPVVELSSSTVKLQAKVVNDRDRIISNFGFNLYDAENDEMFYAQYSAWHEDPYYRNVSYDPETRIISVELQDYPANRTAYVQAFAIYYDGETEIIGFSAGRDKFTTYPADIIINTPVDSTILPDGGPITVEGVIEEKVSGFEYSDTVIRLYDYRMEEIASVNAVIDADLKFKADCDIPGNYAGLYHLVVEVKCGETQIKSSTVKLYIPGKLEVQILPLDDAEVYSTRAFISAKVSDDQGKKIENYGFNIYDSDGNFVCQYSLWHAEEKYCGVNYDNKSGVLSCTVSLEAGKTYYYESFVVYYENGVPVNCFSSDKGILMTKTADIRIDTPTSMRYVGSSKTITVKGSVDDYGAVSVDTPKLFVYVGDTLI
ncbi:MAG: hypothetical protein IKU19_04985, partial [Clostridia bacterium]|nr:hypothetical protein [Clostridia bacterium]